MTNCPNCGAAVDISEIKCPYCGTPYFNMSQIPFQKPFVLKINVGTEENPIIILQKVILTNMAIETDPCVYYYADNVMLLKSHKIDVNKISMEFEGVY